MTQNISKTQKEINEFVEKFTDGKLAKAMMVVENQDFSRIKENHKSVETLNRLRNIPFALSRSITDI